MEDAGESCPGEAKCREDGPIFVKVQSGGGEYTPHDVCHGKTFHGCDFKAAAELGLEVTEEDIILRPCRLLPTKPGQEPPELRGALQAAAEWDELIKIGLTVRPADLTPRETACLRGAHRGRTRAEASAAKKRDAKKKLNAGRKPGGDDAGHVTA